MAECAASYSRLKGSDLLWIPAGDHRLHGVVGVVDSQGLQKPVEGTELAEEGLPAKTEAGGGSTVGSCWNYILHNNGHRDSCAGLQ